MWEVIERWRQRDIEITQQRSAWLLDAALVEGQVDPFTRPLLFKWPAFKEMWARQFKHLCERFDAVRSSHSHHVPTLAQSIAFS